LAYAVDTSTLLDLHVGGILLDVAKLGLALVAPDFVIAEELLDPPGSELVEAGILRAEKLMAMELQDASNLHREHSRSLSYNDCACLLLAEKRGLVLLTSEQRLRAVAEGRGIQVRGTLWLMDEMVRLQQLTRARAAAALEQMVAQSRRLPADECQRRLRRWKRT
jgi:predicted nucleic acid-binding protein